MQAGDFFSVRSDFSLGSFFSGEAKPWEWLPRIAEALQSLGSSSELPKGIPPGCHLSGPVFAHPSVKWPPFCTVEGPVYLDEGVEIRPGAYLRGRVIVGRGCVLGNSCEYKNCLLLDEVETAHFNYVGDSILGNRAHLGAGVICANLKLDRGPVSVMIEGVRYATGLRKVGAFLGDGAEVGCNSVLQPGTILGREAAVISMPFHGYLPAGMMALPTGSPVIVTRPRNGVAN
ncbi:MAG: UDP-N-acetylglucosamine diphosphorylase [Opitutales bacterium]|nr:UDP-N-acetylglucosamine diphosphorylase [Opitutales bacterium]